MKNLISFIILLMSIQCSASKADSLSQRHQINFSVTNAVSQQFFNGPNGATTREITGNWFYSNIHFEPNYTVHVRLNYSVELSKILRLETGIGYLIEGETLSGFYSGEVTFSSNTAYDYTGALTVPLHLKFNKPTAKGAFTCTLGPDFSFPIHHFGKQVDNQDGGNAIPDGKYHVLFNTANTVALSNLGFDLKMGYEKKLTKTSTIDLGPIINFSDLAFFDKETNQQFKIEKYRPYQYYVGFDVAFIFDVRKK